MSLSERISALTPVQRQLLEVLRKKTSPRPATAEGMAPPPMRKRAAATDPAEVWPVAIVQ